MPEVDQLTARVIVNEAKCTEVADLIRGWDVPAAREDVPLPQLAREQIGNLLLLLVSICHQTSPYGRPPLEGRVNGTLLRGWDYLSARLNVAVADRPQLLKPALWANMTEADLADMFRDPVTGDRLTDPGGRAALIRDLGQGMQEAGWLWADDFYQVSQARVAKGSPNLLEMLARFRAYSDPIKKKAYFFLALMEGAGIWSYADPHSVGPPIDYHECRGHLRLGTVVISDQDLLTRVWSRTPVSVEEDLEIRGAVLNAVRSISRRLRSNVTDMRLHYLFWNVFRSCCKRDEPHCHACPPDCSLPDRYVPLAMHGDLRACPFRNVCNSASLTLRLHEQIIDSEYY